jgi:urea transporter
MSKCPFVKWLEIFKIHADNENGMFSTELKYLLPQVISSWQVLAVTAALILYTWLVSYVARTYHRPHLSKSKPKRKKVKAAPAEHNESPNDEDSLV